MELTAFELQLEILQQTMCMGELVTTMDEAAGTHVCTGVILVCGVDANWRWFDPGNAFETVAQIVMYERVCGLVGPMVCGAGSMLD
jgi:hypothetical protein